MSYDDWRMRHTLIIALAWGCGGSSPDRTETVATLPTPPLAAMTATVTVQPAPSDDGWPCARPPIITERQEATLERMTESGRPDLVQQAAEIRAKICIGWTHTHGNP